MTQERHRERNLVAALGDWRRLPATPDPDSGPQPRRLSTVYLDMGWENLMLALEYDGEQQRTDSLWKGELGIAVLIADLESPENARMPFFE